MGRCWESAGDAVERTGSSGGWQLGKSRQECLAVSGPGRARYGDGSRQGLGESLLVRTGVYSGGEPTWTPKTIVDDVQKAVEYGLKTSQW